MHLYSISPLLLGALALHYGISSAASDEKKPDEPCTTHSQNSGSFYDLRPLSVHLPDPDKKLAHEKTDSWHAMGHDYKANFTMNICAPVIEELKDVVGVDKQLARNVSAYYEKDGKTYSIGQEASAVMFRGRKLVLQYTNGSPCEQSKKRSTGLLEERDVASLSKDKDEDVKSKDSARRKSTLISFHCDRDTPASKATISFVGTDPDECAYFFEVTSAAACAGAEPVQQAVGPGGVFGIIAVIAIMVYFIGGIMYQRSVAHARGWRQLPNYTMWAGIGSFFQDMFIIATSSCARCLPVRRGYSSLSNSANGNHSSPRSRNGRPDDENHLIDQLDEEWDD